MSNEHRVKKRELTMYREGERERSKRRKWIKKSSRGGIESVIRKERKRQEEEGLKTKKGRDNIDGENKR